MKSTSQILAEAILKQYPEANFAIGEDKKIIEWRNKSIPQPTDVEIEALYQQEVSRLASELYKEKRAAEYPSVGDQLDAIWKALKGLKLSPEVLEVLNKIESVKTKYPKPN